MVNPAEEHRCATVLVTLSTGVFPSHRCTLAPCLTQTPGRMRRGSVLHSADGSVHQSEQGLSLVFHAGCELMKQRHCITDCSNVIAQLITHTHSLIHSLTLDWPNDEYSCICSFMNGSMFVSLKQNHLSLKVLPMTKIGRVGRLTVMLTRQMI